MFCNSQNILLFEMSLKEDFLASKPPSLEPSTTQYNKEEKMCEVKVSVVPMMIRVLGAVTHKLGEWLQQTPGTTSEVSVQRSPILQTAKILRRAHRGPEFDKDTLSAFG